MQQPPYNNQLTPNNDQTTGDNFITPYPGQFQYVPSPPPSPPTRPYNGIILTVLVTEYILSWVLGFSSTAFPSNSSPAGIIVSISAALLWGVQVSVLIIDWRGFKTLDGLVKWRQMSAAKKFWMFCAYIVFFLIMSGIYLGRKKHISMHVKNQLGKFMLCQNLDVLQLA